MPIDGVGHPRDRREILGLYGRLSCRYGMRDERRGRRQQQDVIVLGADEGVDGDDAVAAGPVLDDDRLAPFLGQPVGQKPPADVGAAAGAERQDELDRSASAKLWAWACDGVTANSGSSKAAKKATKAVARKASRTRRMNSSSDASWPDHRGTRPKRECPGWPPHCRMPDARARLSWRIDIGSAAPKDAAHKRMRE